MRRIRRLLLGIVATAAILFAAESGYSLFEKGLVKERADADLRGAIKIYEQVVRENSRDRKLAAQALVRMGQCYERLGDADARKAYERVVRDFGDQKDAVAEARSRLAAASAPAGTGLIVRQIDKFSDVRYGRAISNDGRYMAFAAAGRMWLHDLITNVKRWIDPAGTFGRAFSAPIISPDGKRVAYALDGEELYVAGVDGSNARLLLGTKGHTVYPHSWSPDGNGILVYHRKPGDQDGQTCLLSVVDGSERVIQSKIADEQFSPDGEYLSVIADAQLSPDGKYLAFAVWRSSRRGADIFVQRAEGGEATAVVKGAGLSIFPAWSPEGTRLLFLSDRNGSMDAWSIPMADGKPTGPPEMLKERVDTLLAMSRDGRCYYKAGTLARDLYTAEIDPATGKLAGRLMQITNSNINAGPAWSPNGQYLAYYSSTDPRPPRTTRVVLRNARTGEERQIPLKAPYGNQGQVQWFPDSRFIFLYAGGKMGKLDIASDEVLPFLEKVTLPPVAGGAIYSLLVALAPDGRAVYYVQARREAEPERIFRLDVTQETSTEICRLPSNNSVIDLAVSPDGSRLGFLTTTRGGPPNTAEWTVMAIEAAGGKPREVYKSSGRDGARRSVAWSPDGRRVYFIVGTNDAPAYLPQREIYSIPAEGGKPETIAVGLHDLYYLNMHPNGRQLVFADEQWKNGLWVIENAFAAPKAAK